MQDGFCRQHHPDAVKARLAANDARYAARRRQETLARVCSPQALTAFWAQVAIAALCRAIECLAHTAPEPVDAAYAILAAIEGDGTVTLPDL